ncbi:MAG: prolyl oligopeptidase family serine peptidase [Candidatus Paceibacterota bacterium]
MKELIDRLFDIPYVELALVSPDRKWVVWSWFNKGPKIDLYIKSLQDLSLPPKRLTDFKQNTLAISWTSDSKNIVASHDYDGDERFRLYKINIDSDEATPLTKANPEYYTRGGSLALNQENLILALNYDFEANTETDITYIYKLNLKTGVYTKIASPEKPSFVWPELNSAGTHILYSKQDLSPSGQQIWLVDIDGKKDEEIINEGADKEVKAVWHPNGEDIIFVAEAENYRKVGLYNIHKKTKRWLIDDPKRNIETAYVPYGSDKLVFNEIKQTELVSFLLDIDTLQISPLSTLSNITPLVPLEENNWLSLYTDSKQPNDLIINDDENIKLNLTDSLKYSNFDTGSLVQAENYWWTAKDGLRIQGWLYRAPSESKGTIIYIHGGPTDHVSNNWDDHIQYLVLAGFNVLAPNYRGSTGFGLEFQEAIKKDGWGGAEQQDIIDGIKSLISDKIATPGKIGVMGTSFGGYSSWYLITHCDLDYVSAAVPICGMTDLKIDYDTTRPDLRNYSVSMMGGTPEDMPEKYAERSPINHIKNIQAKVLIVQGEHDPNVTIEQVNKIENELRKHKIDYEKLVFENEGHGIYEPNNVKELLKAIDKFFSQAFKK